MLNRLHLFISHARAIINNKLYTILEYLRYRLYYKLSQDKLLKENYNPDTRSLIIFLTPGFDIVNGGIMSISSIYEVTKKLRHIHGAETIMCTIPGDPFLLRYTKFKNQNYMYRFSQVLSNFKNLESVMIHIPEYCIYQFLRNILNSEYLILKKIKEVHINIMLQNIKLLSGKEHIEKLKEFGKVTCTTAHEKYSTLEIRKNIGIPLHKLSTYVSPELYVRKPYAKKENIMVVSHDYHPKKKEILDLTHKRLPRMRIQVIQNLAYEEYKKIVSRAKWSLTFGEGLDNYFIEAIFSGGVSFAVYNTDFFTEDFKYLRSVYDSYEKLAKNICSDIEEMDKKLAYTKYQNEQYDICCKYYKYEKYNKNLELFYEGKYSYE